MEFLLRYFQLKAFNRGWRSSNAVWFVVGATFWMLLRARRHEDVVYRTRLHPGEGLLIRSDRPGSASSTDS